MFYGVVKREHIWDFAHAVCAVLGHGKNNNAVRMLLETCAQETHLAMLEDRSQFSHGVSLYQIDRVAWKDAAERCKEPDRVALGDAFGFDIRNFPYEHLAYAPLVATAFARIHYKLIPDEFPLTLEGRAQYWKTHYNTVQGKGTVGQYVANAKRLLP